MPAPSAVTTLHAAVYNSNLYKLTPLSASFLELTFAFFSPFGNKKNKHLNEVIRNLVQTHCNLVTPNHTTFAYSVALKFKNTYTKSNYATHILIA